MEKEKEELIEMMATHLQRMHLIPPLAARIWAILIIEKEEKGHSFDGLLKRLQISKSTLSVNLNLLLKTKRIGYSKEEGARKKYFIARPFSRMYVKILENMRFEKKLFEKAEQYAKKTQTLEKISYTLEDMRIYKKHSEQMKKMFQEIIKDLVEIEEKNRNIK